MYIYRMCTFTLIDYVRMGTKKSVIVEFIYSGGTVDELLHVNPYGFKLPHLVVNCPSVFSNLHELL